LPTIFSSFSAGFKELTGGLSAKESGEQKRTSKDIPMLYVLSGIIAIFIALWVLPQIPGGFFVPLLMVIFTFFFVTVSSRIVGIVGSSSNPVSGMTIATLLVTSLLLYKFGYSGNAGMIAALSVGAVVCIAIAIAGDTSQDLKTGFLVGATPWKQQLGEMIGVLFSAMFIGFTVYLLHKTYVIGSRALPAPQANLMALVIKGVMENTLPWILVFIGAASAMVAELLGVPSLAFAVGLYLPLHLSVPVIIGGLIKGYIDKKYDNSPKYEDINESGILYSSGLIAGEALLGVILAGFAYFKIPLEFIRIGGKNMSAILSLIMFLAISVSLVYILDKGRREK
jgi:putative OPT family oligopeptide transporter